jgi:hypothetical protein
MAPSANPEKYSKVWPFHRPACDPADRMKWCAVCNDFGSLLVLCVECRVGICVKTWDTLSGCLEWHELIEDDKLIYYCPWCAWRLKRKSLVCTVWLASLLI